MAEPVWVQIANLLCGPQVGFALLDELRTRFPNAKRDDVYRAIATAWTYQQAGWLADVCKYETENLTRFGKDGTLPSSRPRQGGSDAYLDQSRSNSPVAPSGPPGAAGGLTSAPGKRLNANGDKDGRA